METVERNEMIKELRQRIEYFSDERLRLLHKSSMPVSQQDIADDIRKHSANIPKDNSRRF